MLLMLSAERQAKQAVTWALPALCPQGDMGSLATTLPAGWYQDCASILVPGCPGRSATSWERATLAGTHRHAEGARGSDPPLHPAPRRSQPLACLLGCGSGVDAPGKSSLGAGGRSDLGVARRVCDLRLQLGAGQFSWGCCCQGSGTPMGR